MTKPFVSTIPNCCRSRLGFVKARFETEKAARKKASKYEGQWDTYPCSSGHGYHVRKHRERTR